MRWSGLWKLGRLFSSIMHLVRRARKCRGSGSSSQASRVWEGHFSRQGSLKYKKRVSGKGMICRLHTGFRPCVAVSSLRLSFTVTHVSLVDLFRFVLSNYDVLKAL